MRCNTWKLGRIVVVCVATMAVSSTGCKTGMTGKNLFSWGKKPSAETLAGSGPTATYPVSPSNGQTPTTIASAASGSTATPSAGPASTSPYNTNLASSPYATPNSAAQANGYQSPVSPYGTSAATTSPYGQTATAPSPYGGNAPSAMNQASYNMANASGTPSYAPSSTTPYGTPQSTPSNSSAYGYNASAPTSSQPGGYRPGSTNVPSGYPGGSGAVAPSTYTAPTTGYQTPSQSPTYSMPTATSPAGNGSIYR